MAGMAIRKLMVPQPREAARAATLLKFASRKISDE
jgi:hypothetical protein